MAKRKVKLLLPPELITAPVVHHLDQDFGLSVTMQRGAMGEDGGWVVFDIEGAEEDVDKGLAWVNERGVTVDTMDTLDSSVE